MSSAKKNVLVVSDTQCGSIYGMLPPDFEASDDRLVPQNPGQKYLWQCWDDMCRWAGRQGVDAVVVNGDVIDGKQGAQKGTELCLVMQADQARAAEEVLGHLKQFTGSASWYFVQGTEYHDGEAARELENVARALEAKKSTGLGTGRYSRDTLDLDIGGVVINFAHHIGVAGGVYRASAADREGIFSALAGKEGKFPKADCVVRSHAHFFVHVEHPSKHIVITPAWQLQTRFMRKLSTYKMVPDIGAVLLTVDPEAKKEHMDPIVVTKRLYDLPAIKTTRLG